MRKWQSGFIVLFAISATRVDAAIFTLPTGLNPGDQYRLTFVTSGTRTSTSSDIADYNAFVTNAANAIPELAALGTNWSVIGSTLNVAARDNTDTNPTVSTGVPIFRLDGVRVANNNADLWDGSVSALINTTETGSAAGKIVVTGTLADGTSSSFHHVLGGADQYVVFGLTDDALNRWVWSGPGQGVNRNSPYHLYAMSGTLVVPNAVPEPTTLVIWTLLGVVGTVSCRRRRRRVA